jgi:hypothetical protein
MANHVITNIQFLNLDENGLNFIKERFAFFKQDDSDTGARADTGVHQIFPDVDPDADSAVLSDVYGDRVGAKWCYVDDLTIIENFANVVLFSAWYHPTELIEWLVRSLNEVSSESKVFVSYEDEMPNYYGCEVYIDGDFVDGFTSESSDEIDSDLCSYSPEFKELYERLEDLDEDSDEYSELQEECDEFRSDIMWDMILDQQEKVFNEYR